MPEANSNASWKQSPYRGILSVFLAVWVLLSVHTLLPFPMGVFGIELTKLEPAQFFKGSAPQVVATAQPSEQQGQASASNRPVHLPIAAPFSEASVVEQPTTRNDPPARALATDGKPQRILLFGDSMVPVLAPRLADYCLENGHKLFPVVWYGSTIIYWARDDTLDKLLVDVQPTLVIAVLGSSELTVRDVGECEPFVSIIERKVGRRKLLWIGPPNWREDTGVNALVERVLGKQRFFRSSNLRLERKSDGIHPTELGGAAWVDALAHWLLTESAYPILMERPTHKAPPISMRVLRGTTPWR